MESAGVICPKCGYEQEERIDCLRCGVVFNKYFMLHPELRTDRFETVEPPPPPPPQAVQAPSPTPSPPAPASPPEKDGIELAQIRLSLRDITRKLSELDVERAERIRLRGEVSSLDQKISENLKDFTARLTELQLSVGDIPPVQALQDETAALREELRQHILSLREKIQASTPMISRIEQLEARLESSLHQGSAAGDPATAEKLRTLDESVSQLELQIRAASQPARRESDASTLELGKFLKELDSLRTSLQNVTVRYAEIGEMKKNHLELSHSLEALQMQLGQGKEAESKGGSKKLTELSNEVAALRAESRQILKQMHGADAAEPDRLAELQDLRERLRTEVESRAERDKSIESAMARLESMLNERLQDTPRDLAAKVSHVEEQLEPLRKTIARVQEMQEVPLGRVHEGSGSVSPKMESQIAQMENRIAEFERKLKAASDSERIKPSTDPLLELGKVLRELDRFRHSIQTLTAQYSEIAALKKDYAELAGHFESIESNLGSLRNEVSAVSARQVDGLAAERSAALHNLNRLKEEIESGRSETSRRLDGIEARTRPDAKVAAETEKRLVDLDAKLGSSTTRIAEELSQTQAATTQMRADLDGLRKSLEGVTLRYSEIADLKKNQLIATDRLDSIHQELTAIKGENSVDSLSTKVAVLAKELAALRAESKQLVSANEALEAKIVSLGDQPEPEPLPPLEEAIHAIRQNLEEIRRFMSSISNKL